MIGICNNARLDRNPLQRAGSAEAVLELSTSGAPSFFQEGMKDRDLQRADGSGRIVLGSSEQGTRIIDVFQKSPVRIMFPRVTGGAVEEAVLINTGGGVAGGDRLQCSIKALEKGGINAPSKAAEE